MVFPFRGRLPEWVRWAAYSKRGKEGHAYRRDRHLDELEALVGAELPREVAGHVGEHVGAAAAGGPDNVGLHEQRRVVEPHLLRRESGQCGDERLREEPASTAPSAR